MLTDTSFSPQPYEFFKEGGWSFLGVHDGSDESEEDSDEEGVRLLIVSACFRRAGRADAGVCPLAQVGL